MATSLGDAESLLDEGAHAGIVRPEQVQALAHIIDRLPSLAWGEPKSERMRTEPPAPPSAPLGESLSVAPLVLLVGPQGFVEAIAETADRREAPSIECERCDLDAALEKARSFSPDVIVLDADLRGASELLRQLQANPLVESPIVTVGNFSNPDQAANWLAAGAARTIAKPVSPAALRAACREVATIPKPHSLYAPLGTVTVDELAARLADEVRRGLSEAVIPQAKSRRIPLGHGAEVLAAVWAAVARVREVVTIKTEGNVRFSAGPEGALPLALWWNQEPAVGDRSATASRGEPETLLEGYSAIVADDDPAVAWFLASVLRAAGAKVLEAHDGDKALALCVGRVPDLVISDVLMPGLDGFALCRALKRDIALRDVPVILLSWKEDLLQRLRELGAAADGYLRKEASAAVVLQRVTEVLRPRMRIEARLRGQGEVRGRLDGITPRLLLEMVAKLRPDARVCIHDASFLYEVELRSGAPRNATRTTSEGVFQRGPEIFGAMLGARAGRFSVAAADGPVRGSLSGSLREQLAFPVARARAAARLLGGTRLLDVHRVLVDVEGVLPYLGATPESARSLVERLASGDSPRSMILGGEVAPAALEEVLSDLAAHGAVRGVHGPSNLDLLEGAIRAELAMLDELEATARTPTNRPSGAAPRSGAGAVPGSGLAALAPAEASASPGGVGTPSGGVAALSSGAPASVRGATPAAGAPAAEPKPWEAQDSAGPAASSPPPKDGLGREPGEHDFDLLADDLDVPAPAEGGRAPASPAVRAKRAPLPPADSDDDDELAPSSLEAAVIRELSGPTPAPGPVGIKEPPPPSRPRDPSSAPASSSRISLPLMPRSSRGTSLARPVLHVAPGDSSVPSVPRPAPAQASEPTSSASPSPEPPASALSAGRQAVRSSPRPPDGDLSSLPPDAIVPGGETSEDKLAVAPPVSPSEPGAITPVVEPGTPLLGLITTAEPTTVDPGPVITIEPGTASIRAWPADPRAGGDRRTCDGRSRCGRDAQAWCGGAPAAGDRFGGGLDAATEPLCTGRGGQHRLGRCGNGGGRHAFARDDGGWCGPGTCVGASEDAPRIGAVRVGARHSGVGHAGVRRA